VYPSVNARREMSPSSAGLSALLSRTYPSGVDCAFLSSSHVSVQEERERNAGGGLSLVDGSLLPAAAGR